MNTPERATVCCNKCQIQLLIAALNDGAKIQARRKGAVKLDKNGVLLGVDVVYPRRTNKTPA